MAVLGLLTASRSQKIEGVSGLMNLVMMPMWIFSGVFFSSERFPALLQPFIKILPLTALNDALRATILQGASLAAQSERLLILRPVGRGFLCTGTALVSLDIILATIGLEGPQGHFCSVPRGQLHVLELSQVLRQVCWRREVLALPTGTPGKHSTGLMPLACYSRNWPLIASFRLKRPLFQYRYFRHFASGTAFFAAAC